MCECSLLVDLKDGCVQQLSGEQAIWRCCSQSFADNPVITSFVLQHSFRNHSACVE
jgi:hypothetical protein